jgi:hypothetical protein
MVLLIPNSLITKAHQFPSAIMISYEIKGVTSVITMPYWIKDAKLGDSADLLNFLSFHFL